jgi:hypothetical protein
MNSARGGRRVGASGHRETLVQTTYGAIVLSMASGVGDTLPCGYSPYAAGSRSWGAESSASAVSADIHSGPHDVHAFTVSPKRTERTLVLLAEMLRQASS